MEITNKVTLPVVDIEGKIVGDVNALATLFAAETNEAVVHFVCEGQRFHFYKKTVATKGRASVSGGGKKIRQQKGSGGARQGGNRAPHWVGGGIAFGPTPVKREFKINKKMRRIALASVLTNRHSGGQVRILRAEVAAPKTQLLSKFIGKLSMQTARVGFVLSKQSDSALVKSVRNLRNVDLLTEEKWTTLDFVKTDSLIFSETAFQTLTERFQKA